jgi:uncharacterized protein YjbJ (UPF0337 family)
MANHHVVEGQWKQLKGEAKRLWGKLTDDDLERAAGNRDKMVGALQERYGYHKDKAETEFDGWVENVRANQRTPEAAAARSEH